MKPGLPWQCVILFFSLHTAAIAEFSCHLHPPTSNEQLDENVKLDGPYKNQQQCSKENERLYSLKGRCHCSFTPQLRMFDDNRLNSGPGTETKDTSILP